MSLASGQMFMHTQIVPVLTGLSLDMSVCACLHAWIHGESWRGNKGLTTPPPTRNMPHPKEHMQSPGVAVHRGPIMRVQQHAQSVVMEYGKGRYRQERTRRLHHLEPGHKHHWCMRGSRKTLLRCSQTRRRRRCSRRRWEAGRV